MMKFEKGKFFTCDGLIEALVQTEEQDRYNHPTQWGLVSEGKFTKKLSTHVFLYDTWFFQLWSHRDYFNEFPEKKIESLNKKYEFFV